MRDFERIVTHNDLDGIVSAAIASLALGVNFFFFTTPANIFNGKVLTTEKDVVCDLPYPAVCGMWFDHHLGNYEELRLRGLDPEDIPGRFDEKSSCARVVYEYFSEKGISFPSFIEDSVSRTDIVDGFLYSSIDEWRKETPEHIINNAIKVSEDRRQKEKFLLFLVKEVKNRAFVDIAKERSVLKRHYDYKKEEENMLKLINSHISFLPEDKDKELIILDFTDLNHFVRVFKSLAFLYYPNAKAVLEIRNVFQAGKKSNDLIFSMSLSIALNNDNTHNKDVGEIMRILNIGDGHRGAASGLLKNQNKASMIKNKEKYIRKIYEIWKRM